MRKGSPKLKVVAHYIEFNSELVPIDPLKTDLPDRCKLAFAEMATGLKHELINSDKSENTLPA